MWNGIASLYARTPVIRELRALRKEVVRVGDRLNRVIAVSAVDYLLENPRYADPRRLQRYGFQVCSQNYEDGMIHEVFKRIGTSNRVFAEVGVGDGTENNTAFLLSQGWSGFWVDGDPAMQKSLAFRTDLECALKYSRSVVTRENIGSLFLDLAVPKEFDLLSIDIDQNTYYIWQALSQYRPRVVIVEYNAALPPDVDWKVRYDADRFWDMSDNYGASLKAFEKLGSELGYCLVGCDIVGVNALFVRRDLVEDRFLEPFTSENHYEPARYALATRRAHRSAILERL